MPDINDPVRGNNLIRKTAAEIELQSRLNQLDSVIGERDGLIKSLSSEKVSLLNEKAELISKLTNLGKELDALKAEKQTIVSTYEEKLQNSTRARDQKDQEISALNARISELAGRGVTDKDIIRENEITGMKYETVKKELMTKDLELVSKRAELGRLSADYENLSGEYSKIKDLYLREQQEKNRYMQDLNVVNEKLKVTFTAEQMSVYLSNTIDSFNKNVNFSDSSLNYVINEMDVDLKAQLTRNETNEMVMAAPKVVNDNTVSSFKFTIRAVPKGISLEKNSK
jgi:chromosome segregation ATPase